MAWVNSAAGGLARAHRVQLIDPASARGVRRAPGPAREFVYSRPSRSGSKSYGSSIGLSQLIVTIEIAVPRVSRCRGSGNAKPPADIGDMRD